MDDITSPLTAAFIAAVQNGDVKGVWEAIDNTGDATDINVSVRPHLYQHALEYTLLGYYDIDHPAHPEEGRRIAQIIILSAPDLTGKTPYSDMMAIDNIISCTPLPHPLHETPEWVDLAAKAVIATLEYNLRNKEPPYVPSIAAMCRELTEKDLTVAAASIEAVHRRVGEILDNPSSLHEQGVAAAVTGGFWRAPLPFTVEDLLHANAAYAHAAEKYLDTADQIFRKIRNGRAGPPF